MWLCKQCLKQIPEREKLTHEDFHLAMEMSRGPGTLPWHARSMYTFRCICQ